MKIRIGKIYKPNRNEIFREIPLYRCTALDGAHQQGWVERAEVPHHQITACHTTASREKNT